VHLASSGMLFIRALLLAITLLPLDAVANRFDPVHIQTLPATGEIWSYKKILALETQLAHADEAERTKAILKLKSLGFTESDINQLPQALRAQRGIATSLTAPSEYRRDYWLLYIGVPEEPGWLLIFGQESDPVNYRYLGALRDAVVTDAYLNSMAYFAELTWLIIREADGISTFGVGVQRAYLITEQGPVLSFSHPGQCDIHSRNLKERVVTRTAKIKGPFMSKKGLAISVPFSMAVVHTGPDGSQRQGYDGHEYYLWDEPTKRFLPTAELGGLPAGFAHTICAEGILEMQRWLINGVLHQRL